jgi:hypothetical protein
MLRNLFRWPTRVVEIIGPSNHRQTITHDEYISRTIAERRCDAELMRLGFSVRKESDYLVEHVMRR